MPMFRTPGTISNGRQFLGVLTRLLMATDDFFRARLETMIDLRHPLAVSNSGVLGILLREVRRKMTALTQEARDKLTIWLERAERIRTQKPKDKNKLYALHAPEVECIGKGKARKPYEFGVKVSLAITEKSGLVVGAHSFPGNPFDGHTLAQQIEQTNTLLEDIGTKPTTAVVDLGFRGVDAELKPVEVVHRGKYKSLSKQQRRWLKRRQAIEPAIGHAKQDHRMGRCWALRVTRNSKALVVNS